MRTCTVCEKPKPLDEFPGKAQRCLECRKEANRQKQQRYRERLAAMPNRVCPHCEQDLPASAFTGGNTLCRACHRDYQNAWRCSSPQRKLKQLRNAARNNARKQGVPFDLPVTHLEALWEQQEGKCLYTGTELTWASDRADTAISLDRRVPAEGYVEGNVVLACWAFNRMKQNFTFEELAGYCRRYLDWYERAA